MKMKYRVHVLFFIFLVIITLYTIKSKVWELNFSTNYQPGLPSSNKSGQDWKLNFSTNYQPGLPSSNKSGQDWKLNFSTNYHPDLPSSQKSGQDWKLNFSTNYQPGLPSSNKSGQDLKSYSVFNTSLPAKNTLQYVRRYGQDLKPYSVFNTSLPAEYTLQYVRRYGQVDYIPSKEELVGATEDQLVSIYNSYLDNVDYLCHRQFRMGKIGDGGWEICDDFEYRPLEPCTIFSFGINYDFSFDDDASALYGCQVYTFDPSMKNETHKRSEKVYFYKIGIRGENDFNRSEHWEMMTFSEIRAMLNYSQKIIDVVKMNVEESEWESLILMAKERQLQNIRQLLLEYHFSNNMTKYNALIYRLNVLRLVEEHGFRRFYVHKNPACAIRVGKFPLVRTQCYEIHYVNTLFKRPQ